MKFLFLILLSLNLYSQEIEHIDSELKEVKLYRNNGELYHEFDIKLKAGINDYYISNISDNIDINTIIAGIDNKASIYSVDYDASFSNKKKIDKLKDSIKSIDEKIDKLQVENNAMNADFHIYSNFVSDLSITENKYTLEEIKQISNSIEDLKSNTDFMDFYKKLNQLNNVKSELQEKLSDILYGNNAAIKLTIKSHKNINAKGFINYISNTCNWSLQYDLYLDSIGSNGKLTKKAYVYQYSGLDFNSVKLTLSDSENKSNPYLYLDAWYLPLESYSNNSVFYKSPFRDEISNSDVVIKEKFTLKNETANEIIIFGEDELQLEYYYLAIPKITPKIDLIAEIKNAKELNLSNAEIIIYVGEFYKGKSNLVFYELESPRFSLGFNDKLVIDKENLMNKRENKSFSSNDLTRFHFKFKLNNYNKEEVKIVVKDRLPLVKSDRYELKEIDLSNAKKDMYNILTWEFNLKADSQKEFELKYEVKHPEGVRIYE